MFCHCYTILSLLVSGWKILEGNIEFFGDRNLAMISSKATDSSAQVGVKSKKKDVRYLCIFKKKYFYYMCNTYPFYIYHMYIICFLSFHKVTVK